MLNIVVCTKGVPRPDIADKLRIDPATKTLPRLAIPLVVNPLDRHALEAALTLKNKHGAHITALCMGPPSAVDVVRECLALGADRGVLLTDPDFAGADAFATSFTLTKAIHKLGPVDLVVCGMASSDGATEWVGPEMAAMLNLPIVTMVREIVNDHGGEWAVKADYERGYRVVRLILPAVITVARDLNRPMPLRFSGILKARSKDITEWNREQLGVPAECVGLKGSPTYVAKISVLGSRRHAEILGGSLQEKVDRVIHILADVGAV